MVLLIVVFAKINVSFMCEVFVIMNYYKDMDY